jgi:predicted transcriptional regulator
MPTHSDTDTVIHVRAPADLVRRLDDIARGTDRTRNYIARKLLENSLTGADRLRALEAVAAEGLDAYAAEHARPKAPNATEVIAASSTEGFARLRALNEIAAPNRKAAK